MNNKEKLQYAENLQILSDLIKNQIQLEGMLVDIRNDTDQFLKHIRGPKKVGRPPKKIEYDKPAPVDPDLSIQEEDLTRAKALVSAYMASTDEPEDIERAFDYLRDQEDIPESALIEALEVYERDVLGREKIILERDDV